MADFKNTQLSLTRSPLSYSKVRAAMGPLARAWPFRKTPPEGAYLNVGCGPFARPGFFNIDYDYHDGVDLYHDLRRPMPIASGSAGGLFSEHCLEHLSFDDCRFALGEFHRVLKPGAVIRISVPDGEAYARRYVAGEPQPYMENDSLAIGYTPIMSINRIFYGSGHRFIYDYETMAGQLAAVGFTDIRRVALGEGRDPKLLIDQAERAPETLYIEAVR
jgi:predicted SAM-dependent methyltransferase